MSATDNTQDDMVPVEDVNQFAALVANWFNHKQVAIRHFLQVPEGAAFTLNEGMPDEEQIDLKGDTLKGFKFGIEMALIQLGTLPFAVEMEPEAKAEDTASTAG